MYVHTLFWVEMVGPQQRFNNLNQFFGRNISRGKTPFSKLFICSIFYGIWSYVQQGYGSIFYQVYWPELSGIGNAADFWLATLPMALPPKFFLHFELNYAIVSQNIFRQPKDDNIAKT